MKQQLIKLGLMTLLSTTLCLNASSIITLGKVEPKPVDEGDKNKPKEDKIKGATKVSKLFKSIKISIAKENGKVHQIIIKKVSQAPLTCKLMRKDKQIESISKKQRLNLVFDIDTSKLKIDDNITVTNKNGTAILEVLVEK